MLFSSAIAHLLFKAPSRRRWRRQRHSLAGGLRQALWVQSSQICTRNHNYGLGCILHTWVAGPSGKRLPFTLPALLSLRAPKLTWNLKRSPAKRIVVCKGFLFRSRASLAECASSGYHRQCLQMLIQGLPCPRSSHPKRPGTNTMRALGFYIDS